MHLISNGRVTIHDRRIGRGIREIRSSRRCRMASICRPFSGGHTRSTVSADPIRRMQGDYEPTTGRRRLDIVTYREEMKCQIIYDSLLTTRLDAGVRAGTERPDVGYGSVPVAGPWRENHALYEFYVQPARRMRTFDLFGAVGCLGRKDY